MKNIQIAVALSMLLSGVVLAADTSLNPDRVPSVGLDFTQTSLAIASGISQFETTLPHPIPTSNLVSSQLILDLRAPVNNRVTLNFHGGPNRSNSFDQHGTGYSIGAGVRVYLPELK